MARHFTPNKARKLIRLCIGLVLAGLLTSSWSQTEQSDEGSLLPYYWQSLRGHLAVMNAAKPITDWLADSQTPAPLRQQLQLSQRLRDFASSALALPDNPSYRRYAHIGRSAVVWNVVATPELSLKPKQWCFALVGCVSYRGYYKQADAQVLAERLRAQGWDALVYGVPAYSTLGYMNWAGGDPLLSTWIQYPEGELARLMFHELAHQVTYADGDSAFNESFATFVEREGAQQWLSSHADETARQQYAQLQDRRQQFRALTAHTRSALQAGFDHAHDDTERRQNKQAAMQRFRLEYQQLKTTWGGYSGYDDWVKQASNASFASTETYEQWVDAFAQLFERSQRQWPTFYDQVRALSKQPLAERQSRLQQLSPSRRP